MLRCSVSASSCRLALLLLAPLAACIASPPSGAVGSSTSAVLDVCATASEGALCDDGNVCTVLDKCTSGLCKGSVAVDGTLCTDGNGCTTGDSCRTGVCVGDPLPDDTLCTDGDPCTTGDSCKAARCVPGPTPLLCNDNVSCTVDICVAGVGCVFSPMGDCAEGGVEADAGPGDGSPTGAAGEGGTVPDASGAGGQAGGGQDAAADSAVGGAGGAAGQGGAGGAAGAGGAGGEAGQDGGVDGSAAVDGTDAASGPPDLRARGGACACDTARLPGSGGWTLALLAAALARARRRKIGERARRR
jgi:hypothetical protein